MAKIASSGSDSGKTLTDKESRFVEEYLVDLNGALAAIRAGYSKRTAKVIACENLTKPYLQAAIKAKITSRSVETGITAAAVLTEIWRIATADVREMVEHRIGCCRYCWGENFRYQRTDAEFEDEKRENAWKRKTLAIKDRPQAFNPQGGPGYQRNREPNKDCPNCGGDGIGRTIVHDTRKISAGAAALFAGVKETKEGIEVKLHSKDSSLDKLCRHLGIYNDDLTLNLREVIVKDYTGKKRPA